MSPSGSRPELPGYGVAPADEGEGLLPWAWAEERLAASRSYWIATGRPDGRPHLAPVWGVWWDGALWFSTGRRSAKVRNLAADPRCTASTESAAEAVIVEGTATEADVHPPEVVDAYSAKYGTGFPSDEPLLRLAPDRAFGFLDDAERFGTTATRWTFP
jgi:hypothetical protein